MLFPINLVKLRIVGLGTNSESLMFEDGGSSS